MISKPQQKVETGQKRYLEYLAKQQVESESEEEIVETGTDYANHYQRNDALKAHNKEKAQTGTMSRVDSAAITIATEEMENLRLLDVHKIYQENIFTRYHRQESMPIDAYREEILKMIESEQVVIIHGPTGCGKTTQVPQFILDKCYSSQIYCNIVVTQPRKIAAISVSERVCKERGWALGTVCGYQVGLERKTNRDTILTYMTTGVLLQKLINVKRLNEFTHIIIDEVHERSQEMDFVLILLRKFMREQACNTKIILMSATFDTTKFAHYFRRFQMNHEFPAVTIHVGGASEFTTTLYYINQLGPLVPHIAIPQFNYDEPRLYKELFEFVCRLLFIFGRSKDSVDPESKQHNIGHVLIFLPGIMEIEEMYTFLSEKSKEDTMCKWLILPLHSSITSVEQNRVFFPAEKNVRKIILSTNIAESSITVPDIEYVIDFCLTKNLTVDPITQYQTLKLEWATHVNCAQRAGRVGRVRDGTVYRLVPTSFYTDVITEDIIPEMQRAPLQRIVLCSKRLDLEEPPKSILALAIDPPNIENIDNTVLTLKECGALLVTCRDMIVRGDGDLTFFGDIMCSLPLDIKFSKLICLGYILSCIDECIIMAAGCSLSNIFATPFKRRLEAYMNRLHWADHSNSDLIAHLHLYKLWERKRMSGAFRNRGDEANWCTANFVSMRAMREWNILVDEIKRRLGEKGLYDETGLRKIQISEDELPFLLKIAIAGAFYPNYYKRSRDYGQVDELDALKLLSGLSPMNTVYFMKMDMKQPGILYAQYIKDYFEKINAQVNVFFDSSKVYVTFVGAHNTKQYSKQPRSIMGNYGNIPVDMYKAIKMRLLKMDLTLPVLPLPRALEMAEKLQLGKGATPTYLHAKGDGPKLRTVLPGSNTVYCFATCTSECGHFYVQLDAVSYKKTLEAIEKRLNTDKLQPADKDIRMGGLYAHRYTDGKVYRCRVICGVGQQMCCSYIDYGESFITTCNELMELPAGIGEDIPGQAVEMVLCGIKPSLIHNPKGIWKKEDNIWFEQQVMSSRLKADIYSIVNGVVSVELFTENSKTKSINSILIEKGLAQKAEESYMSQQDHERRTEQGARPEEYIYTFDDRSVFVQEVPPPPPLHQCTEVIQLKGPFSPLEMSVYSAIDNSEVTIDGGSVNSVLLDTDPQDPQERLIVAPIVSQSQYSNKLSLRYTTLMPNIHGMSTLLALLFAPRCLPKPDANNERYAAFLCGLGMNPETGRSIYPKHDITMIVDTKIDNADLTLVNEIRYWMSTAVETLEHIHEKKAPASQIGSCQRAIRDRLFQLFQFNRERQERTYVKNASSWKKNTNSKLVSRRNPDQERAIWPLHSTLALYPVRSEQEEVLTNFQLLRDIANTVVAFPAGLMCKACGVKLISIFVLRIHLSSEGHTTQEKQYSFVY